MAIVPETLVQLLLYVSRAASRCQAWPTADPPRARAVVRSRSASACTSSWAWCS